jgi:hypothetical protein
VHRQPYGPALRLLFEATFQQDLTKLGHEGVCTHLINVQERRNRFVHGETEVIDNALVQETVEKLHDVQAAWVEFYNMRCTGKPAVRPVWEGSFPR